MKREGQDGSNSSLALASNVQISSFYSKNDKRFL